MKEKVRACLPPRAADSHKGTYGTVLSVCGSYGMAGAALLASSAAYRCGAGKVAAVLPRCIYPIVASRLPEAVFLPYRCPSSAAAHLLQTKADAVLVGCGIGQQRAMFPLVHRALCDTPRDRMLIVDADGINWLARHKDSVEKPFVERNADGNCILTPHPLELARLLSLDEERRRDLLKTGGEHRDEQRMALAQEAARRFRCVIVLKGHRTVVADPRGQVYINESGNPGMAVAGSGDVLAGMLAGLAAAESLSAWDTAVCGVYLHGVAGDKAAARLSQRAMLPSDLLDELGGVLLEIEQQE